MCVDTIKIIFPRELSIKKVKGVRKKARRKTFLSELNQTLQFFHIKLLTEKWTM